MSPRTESQGPARDAPDPVIFASLPRPNAAAGAPDEPRYVLHIPMDAPDLAGALDLAATLATSLAFPPQVHIGETAVSEEGDQRSRHPVFCNRLMPGRRRCLRRAGHDGPCALTGR